MAHEVTLDFARGLAPGVAPDLALDVRDARKAFGDTRALDGATFAVARGELVGLLGPNGAGKTTMIRAIAGRVALDAGDIALFGRDARAAAARADLGVVPQEIALYKLLTARENLEVFGALYGVPRADLGARVAWALEWAGLADRASSQAGTFSGGMQRRLNIACSLLHRPRLLLLDEPTVGVDPQSRERIYEMLAVLKRDGLAIILTTHHLEEAEQRCDRVMIIDRGRVVAGGTMAELVVQALGQAGLTPRTVQVSASLQDVFIALTGRELRE